MLDKSESQGRYKTSCRSSLYIVRLDMRKMTRYNSDTEKREGYLFVINDILDADEVGEMLRVHPCTVIRLANQGELPGFKVGGQWRFRRRDIENYIEEQKRRYT